MRTRPPRFRTVALLSCSLLFAASCTAEDTSVDTGDDAPDAPGMPGGPDAGPAMPEIDDPFSPVPDTSEGLTNISDDLDAVLENGALQGACDAYRADPGNRRKKLLCGKAMFFYEGFGTQGVPRPIIEWLIENFPDEVGAGFARLGMIPDPTSEDRLPLGLAPGAPMGPVGTLAFACASCHFGRLPDGRYSVGAPNYDYRYGAQNLMLTVIPLLAIPGSNPDNFHPDALAVVQSLRDKLEANPLLTLSLLGALAPLITSGAARLPELSVENQGYYARWRAGTMDFFIQPLPVDDGVHTVSKITALWDVPTPAERAERDQPSAFLGWTGGVHSLGNFVRNFVRLGGGPVAEWPVEDVEPLVDYIHSLRTPVNPEPPDEGAVAAGEVIFRDAGCIGCHGGPRGAGVTLYDFDEIGTDAAMARWADADLDGVANADIEFEPNDEITNRLKSPRLVGLWAMTRFLHNGSVDSLEQLLCLEGARGGAAEPAFGDGGHTFGCDLAEADRRSLIAYLRAH